MHPMLFLTEPTLRAKLECRGPRESGVQGESPLNRDKSPTLTVPQFPSLYGRQNITSITGQWQGLITSQVKDLAS